MKTKGYVSVLALIVSLLIFSIITSILIAVDFDIKTNNNEKDYYQNCLISESVANKIKYDEEIKGSLNEIFSQMGKEERFMDLYYDEIIPGGSTKLKIVKSDLDSFKINYTIKYNKTNTVSTILFSIKEVEKDDGLDEDIVDEEIIDEEDFEEDKEDKEDFEEGEPEDKEEPELEKEIIYEFTKYWIN